MPNMSAPVGARPGRGADNSRRRPMVTGAEGIVLDPYASAEQRTQSVQFAGNAPAGDPVVVPRRKTMGGAVIFPGSCPPRPAERLHASLVASVMRTSAAAPRRG
eukprot:gene14629-biopygen4506